MTNRRFKIGITIFSILYSLLFILSIYMILLLTSMFFFGGVPH